MRKPTVLVLVAVLLGAATALPATADPDPAVSVTMTATYQGRKLAIFDGIILTQVDDTGNAVTLQYPDVDEPGPYVFSSSSTRLVPGAWIATFYLDTDISPEPSWSRRVVLKPGKNDLGSFVVPKVPVTHVVGSVRSPSGYKLSRVDLKYFHHFDNVTALDQTIRVNRGAYEDFTDDAPPYGLSGGSVPVIQPILGGDQVDPVVVYPNEKLPAGKTLTQNFVYEPRPYLQVNGRYRQTYTHVTTYLSRPSYYDTIDVTQDANGAVPFTIYANAVRYGLPKAGGSIQLEVDGKAVTQRHALTSKDTFAARVGKISVGEHTLKVLYAGTKDTRTSTYTFHLDVHGAE